MKIKIMFLTAITAVILSACTYKIPEMTREENSLVVEYAAGRLLSHDAKLHNKLVTLENAAMPEEFDLESPNAKPIRLAAQPEGELTELNSESQGDGDKQKSELQYSEIGEFLGYDSLKLEYSGVIKTGVYPNPEEGDSTVGVKAHEGYTLVIYQFMLNNTGSDSIDLDIASKHLSIYMRLNGDRISEVMSTLMPDDFTVFKGEVGGESVMPVVMVTELPTEVADDLDSATMRVFDEVGGNANMFLY